MNNTNSSIPSIQGPPATLPNHVANKSAPSTLVTTNRKSSISNDTKPAPVPVQSVAPTTIPQPPKSVAIPAPSPDKPKPSLVSPLTSTYTDPLEQSLANLEHDMIKNEPLEAISNNIVQMPSIINNPLSNPSINSNPNPNPPILQSTMSMDIKSPLGLVNMLPTNTLIHGIHDNLHEMPSVLHSNTTAGMMHTANNGFNIKHEYDMATNNNGLSSLGIPMNMSIPSMFDPLPQQILKKEPVLPPKPIEELADVGLNVDKKSTPPEQKHSQSFTLKTKQEQNVKNASSWSNLAQANSPQNTTPSGSNSRQTVMDSFKMFQNKAKEKADREKQRLENLELKRQQKEQAEKERLRVENERRREREEEDALEKARYVKSINFWLVGVDILITDVSVFICK